MTQSINKGFTLLETLIAFVVLTVGLLGAVALQAQAKQASYDSLQRAAALSLGNDIIQRIRVNDTVASLGTYNTSFATSVSEITQKSSACLNASCNDIEMALFDIEQWKKAIKAREFTGAIANATVCISTDAAATGGAVKVVITWAGRQNMKQNSDNTDITCGEANTNRKMVVLDTFLLRRG
jgi:type IV pilus assembly protein PilV